MLIKWSNKQFALGIEKIDQTRQEFVELVNKLYVAGNNEFPVLFAKFLDHLLIHFNEENKLIQNSAFPASREHINEHQRILYELIQLGVWAERGKTSQARAYVYEKIPNWFVKHTITMDSALAAHLKSQAGNQ